MTNASVIIKPMQTEDIKQGMRLSIAEGWNQTEKDWKLLIESSQNICLVAETGGKVIGTTTAINYSNEIAWIGMVLIDKTYRGMGVSKLLLNNILEKLSSCKSVKLDATPAGQQVYKKFGFAEEYFITRMTNSSMKYLRNDDNDIFTQPIQLKHIEEIIAFDKQIFGANRTQLIEYMVSEYPDKSGVLKRNNQVAGFVLGRDGNKYHHIGPVMASTTADAKALITKALERLTGQHVVVDVLNDKEDLLNWFNSIGFIKQREFARMYKKENLFPGIIDNQYLICGPEFG